MFSLRKLNGMRFRTVGRVRLQRWLRKAGHGAASQLARSVGVAPSTVHYWVQGIQRPSAARRELIERLTGITAGDWHLPRERKLLEAA